MLFFVLQNKSRGKISKIEIEEKKRKLKEEKKIPQPFHRI